MPAHLMPLIMSKFFINAGASGGAMTISMIFSSSHTFHFLRETKEWAELNDRWNDCIMASKGTIVKDWDFFPGMSNKKNKREFFIDCRKDFDFFSLNQNLSAVI